MIVFFSNNMIIYSFCLSTGASRTSWWKGWERRCWTYGKRKTTRYLFVLIIVCLIHCNNSLTLSCRAPLVHLVPEVLRVLVELMYVQIVVNNCTLCILDCDFFLTSINLHCEACISLLVLPCGDDDLSLSYVLLQGPQGPPGGVGPMGSVGEKVRIKTWHPSVLCLHWRMLGTETELESLTPSSQLHTTQSPSCFWSPRVHFSIF